MNRYKLAKAGINVNEGIMRLGGDQAAYEEYLYKFPEDGQYKLLCDALLRQDAQAAFLAAHALKGIAGNLSLTKLYGDVSLLVERLRSGGLEGAASLIEQIDKDYAAVIAALI